MNPNESRGTLPLGRDSPNNPSLATPSTVASTRRLRRRRPPLREWPAKRNHALMSETSTGELQPRPIPLNIYIRHFLYTFLSAPFSLGHERERGGVESQASVCILGGCPNDLREVPRKQKTPRPERGGITRAVSPKKSGKRKKGMSKLRKSEKRAARRP